MTLILLGDAAWLMLSTIASLWSVYQLRRRQRIVTLGSVIGSSMVFSQLLLFSEVIRLPPLNVLFPVSISAACYSVLLLTLHRRQAR